MSGFAYKKNKGWLLSGVRKGMDRRFSHILMRDEFHRLIEYERVRCDRYGDTFSLVLIDISHDIVHRKHKVATMISMLRQAVRSVDRVGWFEKDEVGVMLPSSDSEQAAQFCAAMVERFPELDYPTDSYTYPDKWIRRKILSFPDSTESKDNNYMRQGKIFDSESANGLLIADKLKSVFAAQIPLWKRSMDIVGSAFGLVFLSPLFACVALYIKIVSPGPVFFTQERVGYKGATFLLYKFRTMNCDNNQHVHGAYSANFINNDVPMSKLDSRDTRIYPGGKILRKLAIDELPQLLNIFKGEMSMVGPRPCIPYEANEYLRWHARRFDIVPGLTGMWQVSGKNSLTFKEMIRLDISYSQKMSILLDIKILLKTFPTIAGIALSGVKERLSQSGDSAGSSDGREKA